VAVNDVLPLKAARRDATTNLKCGATLCHWHRNHGQRLGRNGKNWGSVFSICGPKFM